MSTTVQHAELTDLPVDLPVLPARLGPARRAVAAWAAGTGAGPTAVADVVLATSVALAVLGDEDPHQVALSTCRTAGGLLVALTACGGRRPGPDHTLVVRSLADAVDVARTAASTTIRLSWRR